MYIQHSSKYYTLKINYLESSASGDFWRRLETGLNKQNIPIFDKMKTAHKYKKRKIFKNKKHPEIIFDHTKLIFKNPDLLGQSNDLRHYINSSFLPTSSLQRI